MATVKFKLVKGLDTQRLYAASIESGRAILADEMERVKRQRFEPLVRGWQPNNRTSFRVKNLRPLDGAKSQIIGTDKEAGKRLFRWVHQTGTRQHVIRPTQPHGLLVFNVGNTTVFTKRPINHPGFASSGRFDAIVREEPSKIRRALEIGMGAEFEAIRS